jgi:phosphoglycolate phosphatase-like HAD superfamily hydrolase
VDQLRAVDAVIFDCDGVLIDARQSYGRTTVKTVEFFTETLVGMRLPSSNIFHRTIHLLKRSGGFNNDWDVTYTILLYVLSTLPKPWKERLIEVVDSKGFKTGTLGARLSHVQASLRDLQKENPVKDWSNLIVNLNKLAERADASGISSIESRLVQDQSLGGAFCTAVKRFLTYPGNVGESLLSTVFDEFFYGPEIFEEKNGFSATFYRGRGFVETERAVITPETLTQLAVQVGGNNFGIVSGRDHFSARYTLGEVLDAFREEALLFLLDLETEALERLKKPNPSALMKSAGELNPFRHAIYVGDSIEDVLMVKRANEMDRRFVSVSVYLHSDFREELIPYLMEMKTDVILPSVNDLTSLLRLIMEDKL